MPRVTRHQVVGVGGIGALQKLVVVFRARQHLAVFRENGLGDVQLGWFADGKQEDSPLESVRFQAAETRMLVSITRRSGIILASAFARAWP
jgi:hypothetical protein